MIVMIKLVSADCQKIRKGKENSQTMASKKARPEPRGPPLVETYTCVHYEKLSSNRILIDEMHPLS